MGRGKSMTITTQDSIENTGETPVSNTVMRDIGRNVTDSFEHALVTSMQAATWKARTSTAGPERSDSDALVIGTGIEIERRCRLFDTPVEITVCTGTVKPTSSARMSVDETPAIASGDVPAPDWVETTVSHSWLEVTTAGTDDRFFVDPSVPPQLTGAPDDAVMDRPFLIAMDGPGERPAAYELAENGSQPLSSMRADSVPWMPSTPTWPFGTPTPVSPVPTDGGESISVTANTVVETEARDGLAHLPADSVDVIITSPSYRLQRNYPDASAVWGGEPDCEHSWETEELYTDTPIRSSGGAGFNSSDDPAELRRDRWRESTTCSDCGAWDGQLGLEPTLAEYISHLTELFDYAKRVLKPSGSLWVNIADSYADGHLDESGEPRDAPAKALAGVPPKFEIAMRESGWIPRERCAWTKPSPTPDPAHDRRTPAYEHVYRFVLSQDYTDATTQAQTNVLNMNTANGESEHSAPMPKALPEAVIDSTIPDETEGVVLDPFAGSGTVLEAAAEAGHDYLGFEIGSDAARMARERLEAYDAESKTLSGQSSLASFSP